ncbi:M3 family metallopeptidase [Novosphingobium sp. PY1]|uniref:M3 family metallopeptidase n=1 Tax=Novosphingobium sp. PY1 TaxID=1882221 RepID=UPI001A8C7BA7|nr:M3 family metallopeptidase [Novosphingobium sp. PY1]GFM30557.1 oligopeptidase A [Novosphingobium sp. PY1]
MSDPANPLLPTAELPRFSQVRPEQVGPAVEQAIADHTAAMAAIKAEPSPDFQNVFMARELADAALDHVWGIVSHLKMVAETPELREAHAKAEPVVVSYAMALGQDADLYRAIATPSVRESAPDDAGCRAVDIALRKFELAGVALEGEARQRFAEIGVEQSRLSSAFRDAVMDATRSWTRELSEAELTGLPEVERSILAGAAAAQGKSGWLVTLDAPAVLAILTHADDRALRAEVYRAFNTRASDQGPDAGKFDNSETMLKLLELRQEQAKLLGFPDYVACSLALKMAESAQEVEDFLTGLADRCKPNGAQELSELAAFAKELGIEDLQPWDVGWASEKLRKARHDLDEGEIRRFFPLDRVVDGLLELVAETFGIEGRVVSGVDSWHESVEYLEFTDKGVPVAGLYCDYFARPGKSGGAWMNGFRPLLRRAGERQNPIAFLTCNFAAAEKGKPSLLTHSDVVTLFHEMGHVLHHLLNEIDVPSLGGVAGVEWDAVELPSQLMENFAWEPAVLRRISRHVDTGAPLGDALIDRMLGARQFQSALKLARQLEFALFDLWMHRETKPAADTVARSLEAARARAALVIPPEWHRFGHAFQHVFAGGYASGYYSYLWAELLSADAYEQFTEIGKPAEAGAQFRREVLATGGSRPALENFEAFRGRAPTPDALLRQKGLLAA